MDKRNKVCDPGISNEGEIENCEEKLVIAKEEITLQDSEKEKRAAELIIANKELVFQNKEKEKRAAELIVANKELDLIKQRLEKSESGLLEAQAVSHMGSWELDLETNNAIWSDETCRICGVLPKDREQSLEAWMSFIHP